MKEQPNKTHPHGSNDLQELLEAAAQAHWLHSGNTGDEGRHRPGSSGSNLGSNHERARDRHAKREDQAPRRQDKNGRGPL
jgi:hypothetical protein